MTARTLANSHPTLLAVLAPGMAVLDVGCGPGTLTREMARRVAPGHAVGMDVNPEMIRAAEAVGPPSEVDNLVFYTGDIRESRWDAEFDLVNTARMLQWLTSPGLAVDRMARAVVPGGVVVLLDYDHTRAAWHRPPESWARFYAAFLAWRDGAGLDNAIAQQLPSLAEAAGLGHVAVRPQVTTVAASDADFFRVAGAWRMVIDTLGRQVVGAGYLEERDRRAALDDFTAWMQAPDAEQTIHECCVVARRPG
jgi:ubiquinone/menaquinone biosynthesis C-methylase UbiE